MKEYNQRYEAKKFKEFWKGKGYEKGESQKFWLHLLKNVFGIEQPESFINFEEKVKLDNTSFIDGFIPSTHVMIEQKSRGKYLNKGIRQSDGTIKTPFQQAKSYSIELPYSNRPRWIVTCNFEEFYIYDMEMPNSDPQIIKLENLDEEFYRLNFLVNVQDTNVIKQTDVSLQAGELVAELYNLLLNEYIDKNDTDNLESLNILCVRIVFCLYAEDAHLFGSRTMFHDYLYKYKDLNFRNALINLFNILSVRPEDRDPYTERDLLEFPYVNGGLFENENIIIPRINEEIIDLILNKASANFDWSKISPTIFGSVFESTLNPDKRKTGGMHYTSIQNIHKIIDPLFLNDLRNEFEEIKEITIKSTRNKKLKSLQDKISNLVFLDPAAGSGNFLTETYISLRRLENDILKILFGQQMILGDFQNPIKVNIKQFYGIEINDFAVTVARTALWIAESQMMKETEDIIHTNINFFPLKSYSNIIEGNALELNWNDVIPKEKVNYIIGNPPFIGHKNQNTKQRNEIKELINGKSVIDYVSGWYFKAADYINGTSIEVAFVSTNSITQGEQTEILWRNLTKYNIIINFAYHSFEWISEAKNKANVYCVIISFSQQSRKVKKLFKDEKNYVIVKNINSYLLDAPNILIRERKTPIFSVQEMRKGNQPTDDGNLILSAEEKDELIKKEPVSEKYIKKLKGAKELINNTTRYCLWLINCSPHELSKMPSVKKRVEAVRNFRLNSTDKSTIRKADTPTLFRETNNFDNYIAIPASTSSLRRYIPIDFFEQDVIPTNLLLIIPNADKYLFSILMSNVHMSWMRVVGGRQGNGYRYSKKIVYNNFPFIELNENQKIKLNESAERILEARKLYPDSTLKELYNEITMPSELRKAHQENDKLVMQVYGFNWRTMNEIECVEELMKIYKKLQKK